MEVIAALHTQLSAANAELESILQQTNQNAKDILRLETGNKANAEQLLQTAKETAALRSQLEEEAKTVALLEYQTESVLRERETLKGVINALLPSTMRILERNRDEMRRLKAAIHCLLEETSQSAYFEEQIQLVQLQMKQFQEECRSNKIHDKPAPSNEFDEKYFMRCIEEEENKMTAGTVPAFFRMTFNNLTL